MNTHRVSAARFPGTLALLLALSSISVAFAHEPAPDRIARISELINVRATAALLVERAELHRLTGRWAEAVRDCDAAAALDPHHRAEVELCRSRIALDRGRAPEAAAHARESLSRWETAPAYRALSLALEDAGLTDEAARALRAAIAHATPPRPGDFLRLARLQAGDPGTAVSVLDEGMDALGPLPVLQSEAARMLADARRFDEALARLDALVRGAERPEAWLAERARILESAGRLPESWVAASDALAAIEELPARRRSAPAVRELEAELRARLAAGVIR